MRSAERPRPASERVKASLAEVLPGLKYRASQRFHWQKYRFGPHRKFLEPTPDVERIHLVIYRMDDQARNPTSV
jgi:hypothetical protein